MTRKVSLLERLDLAAHWLNRWHLLPMRAFYPICDRMELALGVPRELIDRERNQRRGKKVSLL